MSLDASRNRIVCDNNDCARDTRLPISVRMEGESPNPGRRSSAAGWVFVRGTYEVRHYCPDCGGKLLR
jgi:hypothetical protein